MFKIHIPSFLGRFGARSPVKPASTVRTYYHTVNARKRLDVFSNLPPPFHPLCSSDTITRISSPARNPNQTPWKIPLPLDYKFSKRRSVRYRRIGEIRIKGRMKESSRKGRKRASIYILRKINGTKEPYALFRIELSWVIGVRAKRELKSWVKEKEEESR